MSQDVARMAALERAVLRPGARDVSSFGPSVTGQFGRLVAALAEAGAAGARVGLVTGAYMAWAERPAAETDGPVGVAILARALSLLGAEPVVITDEPCADVTRACQVEMGLADPVVLPVTATEAQVAAAVGALGLAHLVAVERLGPNRDGRVMTMRAVDITASTAHLHAAFSLPGLGTGAVGDGGNEIGMANVPVEVVAGTVDHGADIACRTAVDDLVVAGTSNWGCYGLVAGLAVAVPGSRSRLKELLAPAVDTAVLAAATAAGGIDGVRGVPSASVDGVDADSYGDLLDQLGGLVP